MVNEADGSLKAMYCNQKNNSESVDVNGEAFRDFLSLQEAYMCVIGGGHWRKSDRERDQYATIDMK